MPPELVPQIATSRGGACHRARYNCKKKFRKPHATETNVFAVTGVSSVATWYWTILATSLNNPVCPAPLAARQYSFTTWLHSHLDTGHMTDIWPKH